MEIPPIGENGRRFKRRNSATAAMLMAQRQAENTVGRFKRRHSATAAVSTSPIHMEIPPIGENGRRFKRRNSATAAMLMAQRQAENISRYFERRCSDVTMNSSQAIFNSHITAVGEQHGRRFKRRNSATASIQFSHFGENSKLGTSDRSFKSKSPTIQEK